jgi:hypothetical protein
MVFVQRQRHSSCNISSATRLLCPNFIPREFGVTARRHGMRDFAATISPQEKMTKRSKSETLITGDGNNRGAF